MRSRTLDRLVGGAPFVLTFNIAFGSHGPNANTSLMEVPD